MIYVILGMHKSGTTLVSQILHHSGINMGEGIDTGISYDRGNKCERESTLALNLDLLGPKSHGSNRGFHLPDTLQMTKDQRARMRGIIQDCNKAYTDWGFKDPRTALVYPLWASELPEHRIIAIYRLPGEIWPRFRCKRLHYCYRNPYRALNLMKGWCKYNSNIISYLQNTTADFLVLNYQELVTTDAEFNRLQEFVGIKLADRRRQDLYRSRSQEHPLMKIAAWLVGRQTGCPAGKLVAQFEALRRSEGSL